MILYQHVRPGVHVGVQIVPKDDGLLHDYIIEGGLEVLLHLLFEQVLKPVAVLVIDQTILEYTAALVVPQAQKIHNALKKRNTN